MSAYHPKAVVLGCAPEPPLLGRTGPKTQESRYAIRPLLFGGFGLICVSADRTSVLNKEPIRKSRMNFEILSIDNEFPNSIESNIQSQPLLMGAELAILAAVLAVILLIVIPALALGVAPAKTSTKVREFMLEAIPNDIEGTIFELGPGWGALAFALARRFPRFPVRAFEISPVPWLYS